MHQYTLIGAYRSKYEWLSDHISNIVRRVFNVQKLLQKPTVNHYPPSENDRMLADEFATFFTNKIDTLHNDVLV